MHVQSILKKASETVGFNRVRYVDHNTPTSMDNVVVMPFFGDVRSTFILSSVLLQRYKEESKGSKYFILCSWPGFQGLFPYVDEYWEISSKDILERVYYNTQGFENESPEVIGYIRGLHYFFDDVVTWKDFHPYYNNGFTKEFFDRYKHIKVSLPSVPSGAILGRETTTLLAKHPGTKLFFFPNKKIIRWRYGKTRWERVPVDFWKKLLDNCLDRGFAPVVYQNFMTHDLSPEYAHKCVFVNNSDISSVLGAMRFCGCTLDLFSGISRLSIAARCPFVMFDERLRYRGQKEEEIDDLCGHGIPREYIFSFPTIIEGESSSGWKLNVFDSLFSKLDNFVPDLDRDTWPSTAQNTVIMPYDKVRKKKMMKLGTKFIKVNKD